MNRDLFTPVVPLEITHPLFRGMKDGPGHEAARQMMNLVFANFHDVDKSFIREFQTGGFSARVFELSLFAYLQEQGLELDRSEARQTLSSVATIPLPSRSPPPTRPKAQNLQTSQISRGFRKTYQRPIKSSCFSWVSLCAKR
jgi:hypothetical protein